MVFNSKQNPQEVTVQANERMAGDRRPTDHDKRGFMSTQLGRWQLSKNLNRRRLSALQLFIFSPKIHLRS